MREAIAVWRRASVSTRRRRLPTSPEVRDQILYGGNGKVRGIIRIFAAASMKPRGPNRKTSMRTGRCDPAPTCHGERLKPQPGGEGKGAHDVGIREPAITRRTTCSTASTSASARASSQVASSKRSRIAFASVRLWRRYLTLGAADDVVGGEGQRTGWLLRLARTDRVLYVLANRPRLHQRDNRALLGTLHHLRDLGNTIVVVEHDEETIRWPTTYRSCLARGARRQRHLSGDAGGAAHGGRVRGKLKRPRVAHGQYCAVKDDRDARCTRANGRTRS